ncbi:MAG: hypothetical protein E6J89_08075 [Deltaproteobacteria bacterium]|nr:MAG: hypothetical protein E6J89_08075 [Deltaproteobacteria bacterium]
MKIFAFAIVIAPFNENLSQQQAEKYNAAQWTSSPAERIKEAGIWPGTESNHRQEAKSAK